LSQKTQKNSLLFSVVVLFAINILNFYDRHVPGALVEPMRKEFHLNDTQIGLLGSAFIWIYAIIGVPLGRLADSASRKQLLSWGVVIWTALTASAGLVTTYTLLLLSRAGVGVGEAACAPTATSWLGDLFPPAKRSRVLALFMLGVPIGGALGYFFSGPLAQAYGWRAAMVFAAVPALVLVPALLLLKEPERGASEIHRAPLVPSSMWSVLRIPTLWWIIASGALLNFNAYAFATFLPAFLSRVHGLSLAKSGIATGIVYLVGGVSGGVIAGYLGDSIVPRRKDGRMLCAAALALVTIPFACVGILQPAGSLFIAMLFLALAYSSLTTYYGLVYSAIQDIVAPTSAARRWRSISWLCTCAGILRTTPHRQIERRACAPRSALAGSATVTETFRAIGLPAGHVDHPVLCTALAFVLYMGSRTIIADMAQRESPAHVATIDAS
jgi:predicted MFS family arabinose efflux permease